MGLFSNIRELTGSRHHEVSASNRDIHDHNFLRRAKEKGVALPTSEEPERTKFHGAKVFTPKAGIHEHVFYVDVSGMYPNQIRALNASPEMVIGDEEDFAESPYDRAEAVWGYIDPRPIKRLSDGESYRNYTDGEYKIVYDPNANEIKYTDDDNLWEHTERLYFVDPEIEQGLVTEETQKFLDLTDLYSGKMYESVKRVRNCFTPDTEVLTPEGVQNIRNLDVGDEVYSLDPDTMEMQVKPVTDVHEYPEYDGRLHDFETTNVDFSVTPNHNMLVRKVNSNNTWSDYQFVGAGNLDGGSSYELPSDWDVDDGEEFDSLDLSEHFDDYEVLVDPDVHGHTFAAELGWYPDRRYQSERHDVSSGYVLDAEDFEGNKETILDMADVYIHGGKNEGYIPLTYDGDDVIELLCWFVTEGSSYVSERKEYESATRGVSKQVALAQETAQHRDAIRDLLERMGLFYSERDRSFEMGCSLWHDLLVEWCGEDSYSKRLPEWLFDVSKRQLELAFETLVAGDGDERDESYRYSTASDELRDDFMRLAAMLGRNPRYTKDSGSWRVWFSETKNTLRPARCESESTADDGVYCVTVEDNHTLLAGRNGKFQWVGQSEYGVLGDKKFRLYDWRLAEAITLAGRRMITWTAEQVRERLQSKHDVENVYVTHGDTDGVGIAIDGDGTRGHYMPLVQECVEWLNGEGYEQFMAETFNASGQYAETEIETYSPRLFIPQDRKDPSKGAKKTYAERVTWDEGEEVDELEVTGFEAIRSDIADVTESVQMDVLEDICYHRPAEAKDRIFPRVREAYEAVANGAMSLAKIGNRQGLSKDPREYGSANRTPQPPYRGAKYAAKHIDGEVLGAGSKPYVYYVDDVGCSDHPSVFDTDTGEDGTVVDVIAVEDPRNLPDCVSVDYEKQADKVVRESVEPILDTMGWRWDDVIYSHSQSELGEYAYE